MSDTMFSVSDLQERYGLKRNALINRINSLGLKPQKMGRNVFYLMPDVEILDRLNNQLCPCQC